MELVINIPEEIYKLLKSEGTDLFGAEYILNAVANGIPLPKGHGRLIDANKVDTAIYECFDGIQFYDGTGYDIYQESKESIDNIQPIIEADKSESEEKS